MKLLAFVGKAYEMRCISNLNYIYNSHSLKELILIYQLQKINLLKAS